MKRLKISILMGAICLVTLPNIIVATPVSGPVWGYWDLWGSPYYVEGDLLVPWDSLLVIKPGVHVIFEGDYEFVVDGRILALGAPNDSIVFTAPPGVTWNGFKYMFNPDTSAFYYCIFEYADNYPSGYGGVFYLHTSAIIVEHSTFQNNRANRGAAMYLLWDYVSFRYNVCHSNRVYHCGGAINFAGDANSVIERCVFYDNSSWPNPGGAIYLWDDHSRVINCTLVENSSPAILSINGSTTTFLNCIFWFNWMGDIFGATYSDIQGGWPGIGNINADPRFVDPAAHNYHLMWGSPCIDAGDPNSLPDPDGTRADMGAYYFHQIGQPGTLTLDLNPVDPPIVVPAQGGSFQYDATLIYEPYGYTVCDAWADLELPNGQTIGPILVRQNIYLEAGDPFTRRIEMYVSGRAMPGEYELRGYLGIFPDSIGAFDSFTFTKQLFEGGTVGPGEPYITISGWDDIETIWLPDWEDWEPVNSFELRLSNAPEPFNPQTVFQFSLPSDGNVQLLIYDLSGRLVATLLDRFMAAGAYGEAWDASQMPSGMYLARLVTPDGARTERCMLVK
ncbi:MAG TPA: right-handed parallel beta-helix repeat-containing protein [bacterium]